MAFSETERQAFFDRGIVRIVRAFSEADAAGMLEKIWNLIEDKSGQRPNDPATWTERQPTGFQSLTRSHAFNSIACPAVIDALNDLLGPGAWNSTKAWGAPLVTFLEAGRTWDVPRNNGTSTFRRVALCTN